MRVRAIGIISAVSALACAAGLACSGGGGGGAAPAPGAGGATCAAFAQGFLPVRLPAAGRGDVAFRAGGDLYVVDGSSDVTTIACSNGAVSHFAQVDNGNAVLRSIAVAPDGRVYAGDDTGRIFATEAGGAVFSELIDTGSAPLTGLAIAPAGFGSFGGELIAAAGAAGILHITTTAPASVATLVDPTEVYVDVAFAGTTLLALDATDDEIDVVTASATRSTLAGTTGTLSNPVGMAVDEGRNEIWVADAGVDALRAVPVTGGPASDRAPYDFDVNAPSGVAYDGTGTLAWITRGSVVVRGAAVPRVDPTFVAAFAGPTVGYGDLEFDRDGSFVLVANKVTAPTDNFLFRVTRAGVVSTLSATIGAPDEQLLSLAIDPATQTIYMGSDRGNVYRRTADGTLSLLVSASADPVLGLELAPATFGSFGGRLVATTEAGELLVIDPQSPTPVASITPSQTLTTLDDLVFSSDGTLYALENDGSSTPRLLSIMADGTVTRISTAPGQLGRPDGIEIDEGGARLLVTSAFASNNRLLAVALANGQVSQLAAIDIDEGFFPSGIVYDRLGTIVYRQGDTSTSLAAVSIFP
jgi:DNA-binding beta-propeller fold protein YncE